MGNQETPDGHAEVTAPRFLCDVMLGRLARWLRLLGYDTVYDHDAGDAALLRRAVREDRVLLTRDTGMQRGQGVTRVVQVRHDRHEDQLRQVVEELDLNPRPGAPRRCSVCNTGLRPAAPREVDGIVPPYVQRTQTRFSRCPGCGRIYWRGTHRRGIDDLIARVTRTEA